ncbi:LCP family protein [Bacillus spongiae]|uniref:Regulatory protein MsrR n=1 Tax=Bacillus spongiae TaxID=2683610 RepID=A0ABU8HIR4_9BACI
MRATKILFIWILICMTNLLGCQNLNQSTPESKQPIQNSTGEDKGFKETLKEKPIHFLVLGVDKRKGEKKYRTDTILVVRYDSKKHSLKVVSIMRDSYVKVPNDKHVYNKINTAFFNGGHELLKQTIHQNFGIEIDYYVTIDFEGFVNIVDTLVPEGIKVNVEQKIIDDMGLKLKAGENVLHGEELLKYARFRHDASSDFGRVGRQQEILVEVMNQLLNKLNSTVGIVKAPALVESTLKYVTTDLSVEQILTLSSDVLLHPLESVDTMRIPVGNNYRNKRTGHAGAVLELNFSKSIEALDKFFTEPTPVDESVE